MTPRQITVVLAISIALLALIFELIRRSLLREKYSMLWIFVGVVLLTVPLLYDAYVALGRFLGIVDPMSFFWFLGIVGLVFLCLQFSLALSTAYEQRKATVQQVALLATRVRELEDRLSRESPGDDERAPASSQRITHTDGTAGVRIQRTRPPML